MTKHSVNALIAAAFVLVGFSCAKTLEPGGVYAPGATVTTTAAGVTSTNFFPADAKLFALDSAYDLVYPLLEGVLTFERDHRAALWALSPEIKHTLDRIRPQAWELNVQWARARQAYLLNPTPGGLTKLETVLAQLKQLNAAALAALPAQK